ncbi:uncharacterized protein LOC122073364 [Macadamia integrifolia]|uniref:uncharacterized protein LOC122073364 n=1 Tax=Macadamia integrifolia TaxID=60698 RepID=UPI001C501E14|nr:uncharacterized protein LOC122073364 [Macadamia integrifolia]
MALRKIVGDNDPEFFCLAKPMIDVYKCPTHYFSKLGFEANVICNTRRDKIPNLWLLWKRGIPKPSIFSSSDQKISVNVDWKGKSIMISSVHASNFRTIRRELWMILEAVSVLADPWVVVGDFNATLASNEKGGPGTFNLGSATDFNAMIDSCKLIKLASQGPKFTWTNNRRMGNVSAILNRGFCNEEWLNTFQDCSQLVLPRDFSDHNPILVLSEACPRPTNCPFRFHKFWIEHPDFLKKVADSWSHNICRPPSYILAQKLKSLKPIIKIWARENFPNFEIELVRTKEALNQIQTQIDLQGMDDSLFGQEADARSAYVVAMKNYEKLWAEKSRIRWLKEGHRNSKDDIACHMSKFYEDFHKGVLVIDHLDLLDAIPRLIDEVDLLSLDAIPGPNEIKRAVWDLDPDSSPGPDGYPGYFFRCCWNIISGDFERAVNDLFTSGLMPPGMNNNLLVLIPKINGAMSLDKFRPLCHG